MLFTVGAKWPNFCWSTTNIFTSQPIPGELAAQFKSDTVTYDLYPKCFPCTFYIVLFLALSSAIISTSALLLTEWQAWKMSWLIEGLKTDVLWGSSAFSLTLEHFQNIFKTYLGFTLLNQTEFQYFELTSYPRTYLSVQVSYWETEEKYSILDTSFTVSLCQPRLWLIWWAEQKRGQTTAILETKMPML